jgi:hypothetical protein
MEKKPLKLENISVRSSDGFLVKTNLETNISELSKLIGNAWSAFSGSITQTQKLDEPGIIYIVRYGPRELLRVQQIGENPPINPASKYFCIDRIGDVNEEVYSKFHRYLQDIVHPNPVPVEGPQPNLQPTH